MNEQYFIPVSQVKSFYKEGGMVFINNRYYTAEMLTDLSEGAKLLFLSNNSICSMNLQLVK